MLVYTNRSIVLRLIHKAAEEYPSWSLGKKALQKSIYFFNLKHNCFKFKWADFGPMSGEVQQIVHDLEAVGRIEIKPTETGKPGVFLSRIKFVPNEHSLTVPPEIDKILDTIIEFVANKNSRNLELLASVHFWATRNNGDNIAEYVYRMLEELKPNAEFTKDDVERAIDELMAKKILA